MAEGGGGGVVWLRLTEVLRSSMPYGLPMSAAHGSTAGPALCKPTLISPLRARR